MFNFKITNKLLIRQHASSNLLQIKIMKHAWWLIPIYNSASKIRLYAVASDFKMYYQENTCARIPKKTRTNKHINISVSGKKRKLFNFRCS